MVNSKAAPSPRNPNQPIDPAPFDNVPDVLRGLKQFVAWRWETKRDGERTKVPYRIDLPAIKAKSSEPATWGTYADAMKLITGAHLIGVAGIGFVFSVDDPFCGVDFDKCIKNGELLPWVLPYLERLGATYMEVSPSGTGLKCWVRARLPGTGTKKPAPGAPAGAMIEIYDQRRFFTMTGNTFDSTWRTVEERSSFILDLYATLKTSSGKKKVRDTEHVPIILPLHLSDSELVDKIERSKSGAKFAELCRGGLAGKPSPSEADAALLQILAFWTGGDADRMVRIYSNTARGRDHKWASRPDYRQLSVDFALSNASEFYTPRPERQVVEDMSAEPVTCPTDVDADQGDVDEVIGDDGLIYTIPRPNFPDDAGFDEPEYPEDHGGIGSLTEGSDPVHPGSMDEPDRQKEVDQVARSLAALRMFSNQHTRRSKVEGKTVEKAIPSHIYQIDDNLEKLTPGWPKAVGQRLFVESHRGEPEYLDSPARLFAYICRHSTVEWGKGDTHVSQQQYYEHKRMTAERYDSVESLPHVPAYPTIYYMGVPLPQSDGTYLDRYLDFFSPSTEADKSLLKAMVITPLWGGELGSRPGFVVSGPPKDKKQGRGIGKTKLIDITAAELYGGSIRVSLSSEVEKIITRLLSKGSFGQRIVRLDNIKTNKLSSAELEDLITVNQISGHSLFLGEGQRPNNLTWYATINGVRLSADMSQRMIPVELKRAKIDGSWESRLLAFARENRMKILADAAAILSKPTPVIEAKTRCSAWEVGVLAKLPHLKACQDLILERQKANDEDGNERDAFRDHIIAELRERLIEPQEATVFIPNTTMADWLSEFSRERIKTKTSTAHVKGLSIDEIEECREADQRGFKWIGQNASMDKIYKINRKTGLISPA